MRLRATTPLPQPMPPRWYDCECAECVNSKPIFKAELWWVRPERSASYQQGWLRPHAAGQLLPRRQRLTVTESLQSRS